MNVKIYVEGGGDSKPSRTECREAFEVILRKAGIEGRMPRIVPCGGRNRTYDDFKTALAVGGKYTPVLLVDSEGVVRRAPWDHLQERDGWDRPAGATDDQAQLMVACMETWVVADRAALRKMFRPGLTESRLPPEEGLEERSKEDVQSSLEAATRACRERRYQKGRRSFQVVGALNPTTLERLLPHFKRLIDTLKSL